MENIHLVMYLIVFVLLVTISFTLGVEYRSGQNLLPVLTWRLNRVLWLPYFIFGIRELHGSPWLANPLLFILTVAYWFIVSILISKLILRLTGRR